MKTVLFIDDSESHRLLLQQELSEEGYQVITANNNEEVLSRLKGIHPDLIVLELRQKNVKTEAFEKLKKRFSDIPWIGYSTFNECPDEFRRWIDFYLPKTVKTEELKGLIKNL